MKLKKVNAVLGLLSILLLMVHIVCNVGAHIMNYHDPSFMAITSIPFMSVACIHAVLGMCTVFLMGDGTRLDLYSKINSRTVVQRVSAALIFPLLIIHLKGHDLLMASISARAAVLLVLDLMCQTLFFAAVLLHIVPSFSKALITLGLITTEKQQRTIDRICNVLGVIIFVFAVFATIMGMVKEFMAAGGAA